MAEAVRTSTFISSLPTLLRMTRAARTRTGAAARFYHFGRDSISSTISI